jgi:uncharacterized protein HemY
MLKHILIYLVVAMVVVLVTSWLFFKLFHTKDLIFDFVDRYGISVSQMTTDLFHLW